VACSTQKLALAAKLQAKVAQHMAALPAEQHAQLHLLHHSLCLETAARQQDGAALLQCLGKLQPHATRLLAPQRAAILGIIGCQHSTVIQEAACALLLDSIRADGSLTAVSLVPAMLSSLVLSPEQQLRALFCCHQLLAAEPLCSRAESWRNCSQVRPACDV
jgi:hypothetical protein